MLKLAGSITELLSKQFKYFWIVLTVVLLSIALYLNWHYSDKRAYKSLNAVALKVSNNVDGFIEDLFQDVYTLPIYGDKIPKCEGGLLPYLQRITLNNTRITGLIISNNNHKLICSTIPTKDALISNVTYPRSLTGPFKLRLFDQPVYLVQQKMGKYYIGMIIVSSVLENVLHSPLNITDSVALHNQITKQNIIRIEQRPEKPGWRFSTDLELLSPTKTESMFAEDALQSIDGVQVVVFENHSTLLVRLWLSQALLTFLFLLGSWLLFLLLRNVIAKRYSLHTALKIALKNNEFFPAYQPVYDVQRKHYSGVEVLLRWQGSSDEIIMPDLFIEEAEATGLIVPITLQIMNTAFSEFQTLFKIYPDFHLAFNLAASHFRDRSFFDEFKQLTKRYQILPKQVILEVTERDLLDKNEAIFNNRMHELREAGYSLAVDDYGTGHASISYLQNFPFNYLKIDKLFVQAIGTKAITESLNDAIIHMAKNLNLHVIAEGVETAEQVNYLAENGVRFLQGWYFSKALSIKKLNLLLKEKQNDLIL